MCLEIFLQLVQSLYTKFCIVNFLTFQVHYGTCPPSARILQQLLSPSTPAETDELVKVRRQ